MQQTTQAKYDWEQRTNDGSITFPVRVYFSVLCVLLVLILFFLIFFFSLAFLFSPLIFFSSLLFSFFFLAFSLTFFVWGGLIDS